MIPMVAYDGLKKNLVWGPGGSATSPKAIRSSTAEGFRDQCKGIKRCLKNNADWGLVLYNFHWYHTMFYRNNICMIPILSQRGAFGTDFP